MCVSREMRGFLLRHLPLSRNGVFPFFVSCLSPSETFLYPLFTAEVDRERVRSTGVPILGILIGDGSLGTAGLIAISIPQFQPVTSFIKRRRPGYLPIDRGLWETELAENRLKYASLKAELLLSPSRQSEFTRQEEARNSGQERLETDTDMDDPLRNHEITDGDHPLSNGKASAWHKYFQDTETTEQINRDLLRTLPDMSFF